MASRIPYVGSIQHDGRPGPGKFNALSEGRAEHWDETRTRP